MKNPIDCVCDVLANDYPMLDTKVSDLTLRDLLRILMKASGKLEDLQKGRYDE